MTARPVNEGSPDLRYCQSCYDFLMVEAQIKGLTGIIKPSWVPRKTPIKSRSRKNRSVNADINRLLKKAGGNGKRKNGVVTPSPDRHHSDTLRMEEPVQKLKEGKDTNKKISKAKKEVVFAHPGGRPKIEIPEKLIKQLAKIHSGHRRIARILREEHGYKVSDRTVANILNGQRVLVWR